MISIIVAIAENYAIGKQGDLLCHMPEDLKHFKQITSGHTVMMGERTYLSLPKHPLPNRRNIVLTRSAKEIPGCDCYRSLEEALTHCDEDEQLFIIGGASIYKQTLPMADRLYLTEIDDTPEEADAFFPPYDDWVIEKVEKHIIDERHHHNYAFVDYVRPCKEED